MANDSAGKQQISTYFQKDLKSIYENQELYGILKPGAYSISVTPAQGSGATYVKFTIADKSTFVFQGTANDDGDTVYFLTKVTLEEETSFEVLAKDLARDNVIYAQWSYSELPNARYATFHVSPYSESGLGFVSVSNIMTKVPLAYYRDFIPGTTGQTYTAGSAHAYISYLEIDNTHESMNDLIKTKKAFETVLLGKNVLAIVSGEFYSATTLSKVVWWNSTSGSGNAARTSPEKSDLLLLNSTIVPNLSSFTPVTYYDTDYYKVFCPTNRDGTQWLHSGNWTGVPQIDTAYLSRYNYGYTWMSIPELRGANVATKSQVDVFILVPAIEDELDTTTGIPRVASTYYAMTSRSKLRVFSSIFTDDLKPTYSSDWVELRESITSAISNRILPISTGGVVGIAVRGKGVAYVNSTNFLPWNGLNHLFPGAAANRLQIPILVQ